MLHAHDGLLMAHASLESPSHYVWPDQAPAQLERMRHEHPGARVLVLGHTHASMAYGERSGRMLLWRSGSVRLSATERFLLNPGATGQSRQRSPHARALVLDCARRQVTSHSVV